MTPSAVEITLSDEHVQLAESAARDIVCRARMQRYQGRFEPAHLVDDAAALDADRLLRHRLAYGAELAASEVLGVPWRGARPETRRDGDLIDGTEVRSSKMHDSPLQIYPDDVASRPFVLVITHHDVTTFTVCGWTRGWRARLVGRLWKWPERYCWQVAQAQLWDISTLSSSERAA